MITVTAAQFTERLSQRPPEYLVEITPAMIRSLPNGNIEFDETHPAWSAAVAKYSAARTIPLIKQEWPVWARAIQKLRQVGDAGVGDTVRRQLGVVGEAFKLTMNALGAPCSCDKRRDEWNAKYPYADQ